MADRPSLIQQVSSITGCNEYQAETVLERSNWDVERAMNSYFDDPPPEQRPPTTTSPQSTSNAVAPYQGYDEAAASRWDVPNNPAYAPPPGPPPTSNTGWGANNKDVIDLTNDGEADDDLRRAMAASLQDHQSQQQSYRTPAAPSSTVGVSDITGWTEEEHEDAQMKQALRDSPQVAREHFDHSWTSWLGKLGAPGFRFDYEGRAAGVRDRHDEVELVDVQDEVVEISDDEQTPEEEDREAMPELPSRGYRLRDRARLVKPNNAPQTLSEMGRITKSDHTYGRKTQSRGIGKGRRGRGVKRRGSWNLVRSPIDWFPLEDMGMSEDEQLRQALEASVQSHHDLLQSTGSGARTPALPQHLLETDVQTRREAGAPMAMIAPFASLEVAAAILQALHAAPPVRAAFLASRPVDTRGSDLSNYWKGSPPTADSASDSASIAQTALDAHIDLTRRIQTLFAFATLTERPLCVVKDVTALTPSEVVARGSDHTAAPCKVASLYYEFLVESFGKHVRAYSEMILSTPTAEPEATDALWMTEALFLSSGAAAVGSPVGEGTPKMEQRRSVIQLRHDSVNSDVYSCLRAALASDGEGALLTNPANVIGMGVDHANVSSTESEFTIQERIYLDSLMWDRRQGVRLDSELKDLEMVRLDGIRSDLEVRKRKLMGDGGRVVGEVLGGAKRYFDQVASLAEGDEIRSASLKEAAPQIDKILAAVQADLVATEELIDKVKRRIDAKRANVRERAKREAENPQWNQLAYDLCAVLVHEAGRVVTLVKHGEAWWKVSGGRVVRVDKEDVRMGRREDPSLGVFWLVYAKAGGEGEGGGEELIGEGMKAAVADDNLTYESELLSLIRSDAASIGSIDGDAGGEGGEGAAADVNMASAGEEGKSPKTG
ncbi:hypothetical protein PHBOTO_004484 [Pseudozyma hubeiensis]|nr:hypothetical protein PHBOTO_004484 [Pseudozyma hubeiensis]